MKNIDKYYRFRDIFLTGAIINGFIFFLNFSISAQNKLGGTPYTENFNTLVKSGTGQALPPGWFMEETGTNANNSYTASNGTPNSGDTYSFGSPDDDERSLGCLQSGSLVPLFGVGFTNTTNASFSAIKISYTGEQWRLGATNRQDRLDFQMSTDATNLSNGNWKDIDSLDFLALVTSAAVGPLNGNDPVNRISVFFEIKGLNIESGKTFYFRWRDFNATGADDGLGIDDFKLEITPGASNSEPPKITALSPLNKAVGINTKATFNMTFSKSVKIGNGNLLVRKTNTREIALVIPASRIAIRENTASFQMENLQLSTTYDIEMPEGLITDLIGNSFSGIQNKDVWSFTTNAWPIYQYSFRQCNSDFEGSWTAVSLKGDSIWRCHSEGYDGFGSVAVNGFTPGIGGRDNQDWLISPALDLTFYTIPTLSFALKMRFKGLPLKVYVAKNQLIRPEAGSKEWKELEVVYPNLKNENWVLIPQLDISAFKSSSTYIAFEYHASFDFGASQVFLDEIEINNLSKQPKPLPLLHGNERVIFDQAALGKPTEAKQMPFQVLNLSSKMMIKSTSNFEISLDNQQFSKSILLKVSDLQGKLLNLFIRYNPLIKNVVDQGKIIMETDSSELLVINAVGNSVSAEHTLDIVSWNINWFGNPMGGFGPADDDLAEQNIKKVMNRLDADLYFFTEVVDVQRFRKMIHGIGGYGVSIADYCSNATDTLQGNYASGQKMAYVYRYSMIEAIQFKGLLRSSSSAYGNWASGRFPYMMEAKMKPSGSFSGFQESVFFIGLHGKSGDTAQDHARRKAAAKELKDTLDLQFNSAQVILVGDFNDDLDATISKEVSPNVSAYDDIVRDSTDNDRYISISLPLSRANYNSVIGYADVVDHIIISNELEQRYLQGSVQILEDIINWIPQYATTTSDHYPLWCRFSSANLQTSIRSLPSGSTPVFRILGNPASDLLHLEIIAEPNPVQIFLIGSDGKILFRRTIPNEMKSLISEEIDLQPFPAGYYFVRCSNGKKVSILPFVKY
jgi:hypothetical protein